MRSREPSPSGPGGSGFDASLRRLLAAYPRLRDVPILDVSPLGSGLMHQTYAVEAEGDSLVLQRVHPLFSREIHANILAVTRHLVARGMPTPELVPTEDGSPYQVVEDGRCWRLWTRVPGRTLDKCPDAELAYSAASLLARFHTALADLEHRFHPIGLTLHDTAAHLAALEAAVRELPDHPLHADVAALAEDLGARAAAWEPFEDLPLRPAHGDPKFNNVLLWPEGVAHAWIDLDTVGPLRLYAELGDAWRSWCNRLPEDHGSAELDLDLWRAAARGYLDHTSLELSRPELASLAESIERISLELAARFAADALRETYFGWDRGRFERAGEHQLRRARTQLDLHRKARDSREERARFLLG